MITPWWQTALKAAIMIVSILEILSLALLTVDKRKAANTEKEAK